MPNNPTPTPTPPPMTKFEDYKDSILTQVADLINSSKDGTAVLAASGRGPDDQMFAAAVDELTKDGWFTVVSKDSKTSYHLAATGNFWRNKRT
jgi:rubredoxin